jgi:hypothetical protein
LRRAAEVSPPKSVGVCDEITDLASLKRLRVRRARFKVM